MRKLVSKITCTIAMFAAPTVVHAGTSAATGTASMNVINQCSVTGASIDLGTYTTSQSWADVGGALGFFWWGYGNFVGGAKGLEYANFGSVTCDAGTPYTISIKGTATSEPGLIKLSLNGTNAYFRPTLMRVGSTGTSGSFTGPGLDLASRIAYLTGTGASQEMVGAVFFSDRNGDGVSVYDSFAGTGVATDTLTYTLTF